MGRLTAKAAAGALAISYSERVPDKLVGGFVGSALLLESGGKSQLLLQSLM